MSQVLVRVFSAVALTLASGCIPYVIPPATVRLGGGVSGRKVVAADGTEETPGALSIGIDTISLSEAPVHAGLGYGISGFDEGLYLDAGYARRLTPHVRVSVTTGGDYITSDGGGAGPHLGIQLEYAGVHHQETGSEYEPGNDGTHDQSTTYSATLGSYSIGAFIDGGYRWMNDLGDHGYLSIGLIFRLPVGVGAVDVSGSH